MCSDVPGSPPLSRRARVVRPPRIGEAIRDTPASGDIAGLEKLYEARVRGGAPATFFPSLARGLQMQTESIPLLFRRRQP
jgi:hypothetical protein